MSTLTAMAATNNPTKTAPAAKGTETMTKFKYPAALMLCLAGLGSGGVSAQSLILKDPNGNTLAQYPLSTSANPNCTVSGPNNDILLWPQPVAGTSGDGWCPQGAAPTPPTFPGALTVTPAGITTGGTASATWTSAGATSCTATATRGGTAFTVPGWTGSQPTSSPAPSLQFTLSTVGAYVFTISCTNTAGTAQSSSGTINVADPGTCGAVVPIWGLTKQSTFIVNHASQQGNAEFTNGTSLDVTNYSPFFGAQFPTRTGNGTIAIVAGKYVALQFNTGTVTSELYGVGPPNPNRFGTFHWFPPQQNGGGALAAISTCPGEFTNLPVASGDTNGNIECRVSGADVTMSWGVDPTGGNNGVCRLQPNTTYYLNVAYVDFTTGANTCFAPEPGGSSNPGSCHWFVEPR
ncbi:MAG: hypothetical protein AB7V26_11830 [Lysobacterales bacterium]